MDWRKKLCGLPGRMTKEGWIVLLCLGLIMMIVAMPLSGKNGGGEKMGKAGMNGGNLDKTGVGISTTKIKEELHLSEDNLFTK